MSFSPVSKKNLSEDKKITAVRSLSSASTTVPKTEKAKPKRAGRPKAERDQYGRIIKKGNYSYINRKAADTREKRQVSEGDLLKCVTLIGSLDEKKLSIEDILHCDFPDRKGQSEHELEKLKLESIDRLFHWVEYIKECPIARFNTLHEKVGILRAKQMEACKANVQKSEKLVSSLEEEIESMEKELNSME